MNAIMSWYRIVGETIVESLAKITRCFSSTDPDAMEPGCYLIGKT